MKDIAVAAFLAASGLVGVPETQPGLSPLDSTLVGSYGAAPETGATLPLGIPLTLALGAGGAGDGAAGAAAAAAGAAAGAAGAAAGAAAAAAGAAAGGSAGGASGGGGGNGGGASGGGGGGGAGAGGAGGAGAGGAGGGSGAASGGAGTGGGSAGAAGGPAGAGSSGAADSSGSGGGDLGLWSSGSVTRDSGGETLVRAAVLGRLGDAREIARPVVRQVYRESGGRACYVYAVTVEIDRRATEAEATACRGQDGAWALSNAEPPRFSGPPAPCPKRGTLLETSVGGYFQFTGGNGQRCWFRTREGSEQSRFALLLAGDSEWIAQGADQLARLWPLEPDKETWFVASGLSTYDYPTSWYETYRVAGRERVTVPAGSFDTWVIEWEEQGRLGNEYHALHRFFFAPEVGYFVKFEASREPGSSLQDWVATRIVEPAAVPVASATDTVPAAAKPLRRKAKKQR